MPEQIDAQLESPIESISEYQPVVEQTIVPWIVKRKSHIVEKIHKPEYQKCFSTFVSIFLRI
jgi:hypothetical protein